MKTFIPPRLLNGDCRDILSCIKDESVDMLLTDPPYFLDGLGTNWEKGDKRPANRHVIGGLPVGMKFDPRQGRDLQEFMAPIAEESIRILKPGSFALIFSAPRLVHRMMVAFEDVGFEIRDLYAWHFTKKAQAKAFGMNHFISKRRDLNDEEKQKLSRELTGRKTPQFRPQFESLICAQKPREGTFLENWISYETGLVDMSQKLNGRSPETIITVEKEKRGEFNTHLTPKPLNLFEYLIRLFTKEKQIVLDPFLGSGTTCLASMVTGRQGIGIDINPDYVKIARQRIRKIKNQVKTD